MKCITRQRFALISSQGVATVGGGTANAVTVRQKVLEARCTVGNRCGEGRAQTRLVAAVYMLTLIGLICVASLGQCRHCAVQAWGSVSVCNRCGWYGWGCSVVGFEPRAVCPGAAPPRRLERSCLVAAGQKNHWLPITHVVQVAVRPAGEGAVCQQPQQHRLLCAVG